MTVVRSRERNSESIPVRLDAGGGRAGRALCCPGAAARASGRSDRLLRRVPSAVRRRQAPLPAGLGALHHAAAETARPPRRSLHSARSPPTNARVRHLSLSLSFGKSVAALRPRRAGPNSRPTLPTPRVRRSLRCRCLTRCCQRPTTVSMENSRSFLRLGETRLDASDDGECSAEPT